MYHSNDSADQNFLSLLNNSSNALDVDAQVSIGLLKWPNGGDILYEPGSVSEMYQTPADEQLDIPHYGEALFSTDIDNLDGIFPSIPVSLESSTIAGPA
jgi:hypothetical protein